MILIKVKKGVRKQFTSKKVKWIIIPCLLLLIWVVFSLIYSSSKSFTVLQYTHSRDLNKNSYGNRLFKGQAFTGEFRAVENNLGIISVKFGKIPKVSFNKQDTIVFKVKNKGQKEWLYENKYKSGLMKSYRYFPFGFIPIKTSKDKLYVFEITSSRGYIDNAVEVGNTNPIYISKYKFSKSEVLQNRKSFEKFMINKIFTLFTDYDNLIFPSLFLLPFIYYLSWILVVPNYTVKSQTIFGIKMSRDVRKVMKIILNIRGRLFAVLILVMMFYYVIIFEDDFASFTLGLLGCWIIASHVNKLTSKATIILAFVFILFSISILYFNWVTYVDKASSLGYLLLIAGFLQGMYEQRKKNETQKKRYRRINQ